MARCPAHDDKRASLSIRDADGRLLLHCFASCNSRDVVAAIGLSLADLFEKPLVHHGAPLRNTMFPRIDAVELLRALDHEFLTGVVILLREGAARPLTDDERRRLILASQRVGRAAAAVESIRERPEMRSLRRAESRP